MAVVPEASVNPAGDSGLRLNPLRVAPNEEGKVPGLCIPTQLKPQKWDTTLK